MECIVNEGIPPFNAQANGGDNDDSNGHGAVLKMAAAVRCVLVLLAVVCIVRVSLEHVNGSSGSVRMSLLLTPCVPFADFACLL